MALFTLIYLTLVCPVVLCDWPRASTGVPRVSKQSKHVTECQACRLYVESFENGLLLTKGAFEVDEVKSFYERSNTRLTEVLENVCKSEKTHLAQCYKIAEKAKGFIEEWWQENPKEAPNMFNYLCVEKLLACCPKYHFGKHCTPCHGDHNNLCNGNGKCRGEGTRKGNGTCMCDPGYSGDNCELCNAGYYLSPKSEDKIICLRCHKSCMGGCHSGTEKDCVACKPGFVFDSDEGCSDINECDDLNRCTEDQFCANSIGSYECVDCDKSCVGCYADGPDMCRKCAKGYSKKGEMCMPDREHEHDIDQLTATRYMTYVGLLITAGILLPKSSYLGTLVGIMVITYIVGAEYYCLINGHSGLVNLNDIDISKIFLK